MLGRHQTIKVKYHGLEEKVYDIVNKAYYFVSIRHHAATEVDDIRERAVIELENGMVILGPKYDPYVRVLLSPCFPAYLPFLLLASLKFNLLEISLRCYILAVAYT